LSQFFFFEILSGVFQVAVDPEVRGGIRECAHEPSLRHHPSGASSLGSSAPSPHPAPESSAAVWASTPTRARQKGKNYVSM
jgi:hypothetical protein